MRRLRAGAERCPSRQIRQKEKRKPCKLGSDVETDDASDHLTLIIRRITTKKQEEAAALLTERSSRIHFNPKLRTRLVE